MANWSDYLDPKRRRDLERAGMTDQRPPNNPPPDALVWSEGALIEVWRRG